MAIFDLCPKLRLLGAFNLARKEQFVILRLSRRFLGSSKLGKVLFVSFVLSLIRSSKGNLRYYRTLLNSSNYNLGSNAF